MSAAYRSILEQMRLAFPQPVSNPVHDSYFVHSILRALDAVDGMQSETSVLERLSRIADLVAARSKERWGERQRTARRRAAPEPAPQWRKLLTAELSKSL